MPWPISTPSPGNAIFFHRGWGAHWDDAATYVSGEPGPGYELADRMAENGIALTGCDTWSYGPVSAENPDIDFWLTTEDLPYPDNRITVDRERRINLSKAFHNEEPHRKLLGKLKGLLSHIGASERMIPRFSVLDQRIPLAGIAHQCGTVRFGDDPSSTSVLDPNCKAHDLDNLYVVDTSFFPSSSAVNPALTAMANALRVGDHLLERLGGSAESSRAQNGAKRDEKVTA